MPTTSGSYLELCSQTTPNANTRMASPPRITISRRRTAGLDRTDAALVVLSATSRSGIGMQPREQEVDAPEAEDDHAEAEHLVERGAMAFPASVHASMDVGAVNQPHDQRPRLLGIPGPVSAPRIVGPHGAQNEPEGQ